MKRLIEQQEAILTIFADHVDKHHGIPPTVREIGQVLGKHSTSVIAYHLRRMVDDGLLYSIGAGSGRGITITSEGRKAINRGLEP